MLAFIAAMPFILLLALMVIFERPAHTAAPVTYGVAVLGALLIWQMDLEWIVGSWVRAFSVTVEIMLILFGALLLLFIFTAAGIFEPIRQLFRTVSVDARIQAVIIGWFFVGFIEGIAGFGTPAMLAAPLLIAFGFPALLAVIVTLVGDSVAVTFGAVGVPITIGIAEGSGELLSGSAASVGEMASIIHLLLSPLIPCVLVLIVGSRLGASLRENLSLIPFAVVAGASFTIPSYIAARVLTPEFPSIIAAFIGGAFVLFLLRKGLFQPARQREFSQVNGGILPGKHQNNDGKISTLAPIMGALAPYGLIVTILILTRIPALGIGEKLGAVSVSISELVGSPAVHSFSPLYSPGAIFIVVALCGILAGQIGFGQFKSAAWRATKMLQLPFIGLFFILAVVQLMMFSGNNASGYESMPMEIANSLSVFGPLWPLLAPFVGALGSFMSGSSTVSNLLFSSLQGTTALSVGVSVTLVLALQAVGSAVGNMIAVHNIIAAQSVVGLHSHEGKILRATLPVLLLYAAAAGGVGLVLSFLL